MRKQLLMVLGAALIAGCGTTGEPEQSGAPVEDRDAKRIDGTQVKPVTADDVIFSLDAFKKHHPQYSAYYRHVVKAEKIGEREIRFTFDAPGNRELPQIVGQLTILPKHWWEGTDSEGRKRDIAATTLEKPLGSGP